MRDQSSVAVVTGAAQGIGLAVAKRLLADGFKVVISDINGDLAAHVAAELRADGADVDGVRIDVANPEELTQGLQAVESALGRVDVLVNNAGILSNTPYDQVDPKEWDRVMKINLRGTMFASQAVLAGMSSRGFGRIINIASLAGRNGGVSVGAAYAASKAAIIGLSRHLARQVASTGVTVNVVSPGTTRTPIADQFSPEQMDAINAAIPVGRLGQPEEIAAAVSYFASHDSSFTTGAVLDVNGGMYFG